MSGPAPADRPESRPGTELRSPAGLRFWTLPQARHWVLAAVLLSAAVIVLGLLVQVLPGDTAAELRVDQSLSLHHVAVLTAVAMGINLVFGPVAGLALVCLGALCLWLVRRDLVRAVGFGLVACSGWVASEAFKLLVARHRPDPALLFDPLSPETGSNSYPSGHVSFAVALAFALYFLARGSRWSRPVAAAGAAVALTVAWSRLYVGVHYPTDVAASFLAAGAAVVLLTGVWNRFGPRLAGWLADRLPVGAALPSSRS
ncbi:phosphatase PAP2 family protein [Arthrobacter sp. B3I4]|uniref:phosphatase PAP2 family protein n=1 Tax=Arthrobacter sp. B3I4 TaxID=3042267 RepID=UPI0027847640|nr:phosphatase PAP2 family protein [Arthrobacter sp. B3I4]MDQ0756261.1 membrane-associated phospholipid phosphatase [Arthrobacter sp. B3I4]